MSCRACDLARDEPRVDAFEADCDPCKARAIVVVGLEEGMQAKDFAEALAIVFGPDKVKAGEELISAAIRQLRAIR